MKIWRWFFCSFLQFGLTIVLFLDDKIRRKLNHCILKFYKPGKNSMLVMVTHVVNPNILESVAGESQSSKPAWTTWWVPVQSDHILKKQKKKRKKWLKLLSEVFFQYSHTMSYEIAPWNTSKIYHSFVFHVDKYSTLLIYNSLFIVSMV